MVNWRKTTLDEGETFSSLSSAIRLIGKHFDDDEFACFDWNANQKNQKVFLHRKEGEKS